jgi:triphosphoribosyl-dephospho-CoA synthase
VASAVQFACLLEASAPKPGNVSPGRHFHDMRYEDFLASAAAIGPVFLKAGQLPLGQLVREAVTATRRMVPVNTNLGIALLLAPLAKAALDPLEGDLRARTARILAESTIDDAEEVYAAVRLAAPGGLGAAPAEDIQAPPTVSLLETMRLAAHRDAVAREYADAFATTFTISAPALAAARQDGLSWDDAIVECALLLLAEQPDTLIVRKLGPDAAADVQNQARQVRAAGGVRTEQGRQALAAFDTALRDPANRRNPGTTADLTAAACFVVIFGP